jgi:hypothetical protein
VVIFRLPRGHSARNPREGSDGTEVAITVQWVSAWSFGSAGVLDELSPALSFQETLRHTLRMFEKPSVHS